MELISYGVKNRQISPGKSTIVKKINNESLIKFIEENRVVEKRKIFENILFPHVKTLDFSSWENPPTPGELYALRKSFPGLRTIILPEISPKKMKKYHKVFASFLKRSPLLTQFINASDNNVWDPQRDVE